MKKSLIFLFVVGTLFSCCQPEEIEQKPYLIMLSLDGFRWDYPEMANTPVLDSLKQVGVVATSLKPAFPTKTFPNHYTMATGLLPDNHGIVLNNFFATDLNLSYSISNRDAITNGDFYGGDPIWNLAERQGIKSATLFWVGASAEINGRRPSFWSYYNEELPFESRIDSIVGWLSLPETKRPHLIMWYYHEPDLTGHLNGIESEELILEVEQLDAWLGSFFTEMRKLPVFDQLNFIVTSDHGMGNLSDEKRVNLDDYIDTADLEIINGGNPVFNFKVKAGKLNEVYSQLKSVPHIQAWKHDSLPDRLHYGKSIRTQDITVLVDPDWGVYWSWNNGYAKATHGYDNNWKGMHAIFYASGPVFKNGHQHPVFENVDIYPLISKVLNLDVGVIDGKIERVEGMLK